MASTSYKSAILSGCQKLVWESATSEHNGLTRDWLYWYDEDDRRYPTPAEQIRQAQAQVAQERAQVAHERDRSNRLAAKLRALGIDPDTD